MGALRLGVTVTVLAGLTVALMPLQKIAIRRNWPLAARLPYVWQRVARRLLGLRVRVEGTPANPPLLIAANHVSWLDITLLGSVLPVSFISKSEIASWPVAGLLARLQRTVFIDRNRRSAAGAAVQSIGQRVGAGDVMVLFAEGTTGDGNRVLPFRSALLGAAATGPVTVQPVALAYERIRGVPVGMVDRPRIAWYGDMDFVPHFRKLASLGTVDAVVRFGEPIALVDRKQAAEASYQSVRGMLEEIRRGQPSSAGHSPSIFSGRSKRAKGTGRAGAGSIAAPAE